MMSVEDRNRVVEENLPLCAMVARRFAGRGVEYDDLYQVASLALVKAAERYDADKGTALSTFVLPCIVGEVKNYFRDRSRAIRMPRRSGERIRKMEDARDRLEQRLGRSPTVAELAAEVGESEDIVLDTLATQNVFSGISSMEESMGEEDLTLGAMLGEADPGFEKLEKRELSEKMLASLSEMERKVILLRYFEEKNQRQAAAELGVSQMTVSRWEKRAMETLRKMIKENPIS